MHATTTTTAKIALALGVTLLFALTGCSSSDDAGSRGGDAAEVVSTPALRPPKNFAEGIDWSSLPTTDVTLSDDGLAITEAGSYVLSGSSAGQVTVDTTGDVRIVLDGVSIESASGPAIHVVNADVTALELADGSTNTVSDAATRGDETIDGAIFSSDDLLITGTGALTVDGKFDDAIVGKDDLWIESGTITVTAVDDGIRGKDSLTIARGTITVDSSDDGIKSTNATDPGRGQVTITGGEITVKSPDDAIDAQQGILVTGGTVDITGANNGIKAPVVVIEDGDVTIATTGDGIEATVSEIVTADFSIVISGGAVKIAVADDGDDGIDSDGDLAITGGVVTVTGASPFSVDGTAVRTGGTITVNGKEVDDLNAS